MPNENLDTDWHCHGRFEGDTWVCPLEGYESCELRCHRAFWIGQTWDDITEDFEKDFEE
ncbi:MAG TPA: hypothetical protein VNL74_05330 [Methylococcus sp.]|nr:hypothetical protein [Methylococcus sp.]